MSDSTASGGGWYVAFGVPRVGWLGFHGPFDDEESADRMLESVRSSLMMYEICYVPDGEMKHQWIWGNGSKWDR